MRKLRLERDMTDEQVKRMKDSPEGFAEDESARLRDYLYKQGYIDPGKEAFVSGNVHVSYRDRKVRSFVSIGGKDDLGVADEEINVMQDDSSQEAFLELVPGTAGSYSLYALLPGRSLEEIDFSKSGGYLRVMTKGYVGKVELPKGVCEISKSYKDGVLTLKLR